MRSAKVTCIPNPRRQEPSNRYSTVMFWCILLSRRLGCRLFSYVIKATTLQRYNNLLRLSLVLPFSHADCKGAANGSGQVTPFVEGRFWL